MQYLTQEWLIRLEFKVLKFNVLRHHYLKLSQFMFSCIQKRRVFEFLNNLCFLCDFKQTNPKGAANSKQLDLNLYFTILLHAFFALPSYALHRVFYTL